MSVQRPLAAFPPLALAVAMGAVVGCGSSASHRSTDGGDGLDGGGIDTDAGACDAGCLAWNEMGDFAPVTAPGSLVLLAPESVPPGAPFPVAVRAEHPWSGSVTLGDGTNTKTVHLYRGAGSAPWTAPGTATLLVLHADGAADRSVSVELRTEREVAGTLAGDDLHWNATDDVTVTANALVDQGATLVVDAGATVRLAPKVRIEVRGAMDVRGSRTAPVLFTRSAEGDWGELDFVAGSEGAFRYAWITRGGGGNADRIFGHSSSAPVFRVTDATLSLAHSILADNSGKAFGTRTSHVTLTDTITTRSDSGGEFKQSAVRMERTHNLELPDADGSVDDDDNDGVYLSGALEGPNGDLLSVLRDVVFAVGEDDAIDHNGGRVLVERAWIQGFFHEGVACSSARTIEIRDSVITNCDQGVESGYGSPTVNVVHSYIHGNHTGLRVGDSYDMPIEGTLTVRDSVVRGNDQDARNHSNALAGPVVGALTIDCTWIETGDVTGECNRDDAPPNACPEISAPGCDCTAPGPSWCAP
ncbi:MAG: right-handed parallel beta-helix repeat-containing protein [Polyangiales bacterium]